MDPPPRPSVLPRAAVVLAMAAALGASTLGGCKQDADVAGPWQPQVPGQAYPPGPGQWQPSPGPTSPWPLPGAASPGGTPALGLPCATDFDFQCPFAHCAAGRCGGCSTSSDCKPGSACLATLLGMACLPSLGGAQPGAPPPQASPPPFSPPAPAPFPGAAPPGGSPLPPSSPGSFESARQLCVDQTNRFRARVGAVPLTRLVASEPCNDQQAASDAATRQIHGAFGRCGELAQNECPSWSGTPETMVTSCLQAMFDEGPGEPYSEHGHYLNMTSSRYAGVSCGFYVAPGGRVWMIQDFR